MNKLFTAATLAVTLAVGTAACSSGSNSAESKYNAFYNKYKVVGEELAEAFGEDSAEVQSFEDYVADTCSEEPLTAEEAALGAAFLDGVLKEHGLSGLEFVKDMRELDNAIRAEGLCGSGGSKASSTTTTTTGIDASLVAYCAEALPLVSEGLTTLSDAAGLLAYADAATRAEYFATAKSFVATSREAVSNCAPLDPAAAAQTLAALDELADTLDSASYTLS